MPTEVIANPLFANNPPGSMLTPQMDGWWGLDPGISIATLTSLIPATLGANITAPAAGVGAVVQMQSWNGLTSGGSGSPTHPTVALSATTADGLCIGVIQGGTTGLSPVQVVGQAVKVRSFGIGLVIVDNTTVIGHALVQSTGTAGAG